MGDWKKVENSVVAPEQAGPPPAEKRTAEPAVPPAEPAEERIPPVESPAAEDAAAGEALRGQLEGRFDADDDLARVRLTQGLDGGGGGGIAGNDDGLRLAVHPFADAGEGQLADLLGRARAVGGEGGVAKIEKILPGHQPAQLPQDAQAAQAGVEDQNFARLCFQRARLLLRVSFIFYYTRFVLV